MHELPNCFLTTLAAIPTADWLSTVVSSSKKFKL